ncbi:MAG TPA: helix-turn-helix domain-containing protein [Candidatus Limnocylindria bacterium]|nr:helix-turn-helix domain-containing protein [Candidatus Limnocylindria bacterium]
MTSVLDAWRGVDPEARLVSGSVEALSRAVRGVARTRAAPPYLPPMGDGQLLVADPNVLPTRVDELVAALAEAELTPAAVWIAGGTARDVEPSADPLPVIVGASASGSVASALGGILDDEPSRLAAITAEVRLAGAEAALADPRPAAPAGVLATRLRRGVAVTVDGGLAALNPREAGTALATRFAALHARFLAERSSSPGVARRTRDGLWILERPVEASRTATAWLFDDLPFARIDEIGLDALAITLRALLRRPAEPRRDRRAGRLPPSTGDSLRDTLLAVARANGRIAPAARSLGVHRNTVLYRLRQAAAEHGIDPRRPEDALRLLRESRTAD